jgi:methyltransferase (TIGR00027 family)
MVAFKKALIARAGMAPACNYYGIGADLTADWYGELQKAGFDRRQPSAWLIKGLLMYLTEEAADNMLAEVTRASASGSRLLVEHLDTRMMRQGGGAVANTLEELVTSTARMTLAPLADLRARPRRAHRRGRLREDRGAARRSRRAGRLPVPSPEHIRAT